MTNGGPSASTPQIQIFLHKNARIFLTDYAYNEPLGKLQENSLYSRFQNSYIYVLLTYLTSGPRSWSVKRKFVLNSGRCKLSPLQLYISRKIQIWDHVLLLIGEDGDQGQNLQCLLTIIPRHVHHHIAWYLILTYSYEHIA